jgi:hypothetical protein
LGTFFRALIDKKVGINYDPGFKAIIAILESSDFRVVSCAFVQLLIAIVQFKNKHLITGEYGKESFRVPFELQSLGPIRKVFLEAEGPSTVAGLFLLDLATHPKDTTRLVKELLDQSLKDGDIVAKRRAALFMRHFIENSEANCLISLTAFAVV